ncbi:response regulator transcription factor [Paenibacillus filicis]|uniref:Response regulator transcription factor n=1 Tax=Paenibacillus filicis TaxID=669464 RepID=A0ABU9DMM0_9BACL
MQRNVLIADDDPKIAELVGIYLRNEGYGVYVAADGIEALQVMDEETIDLVVLDVMMPRLDGIQTCIRIRETRTVPILMLSAKDGDLDKISGLMTGADDYMVKPFNPLELLARVKSLFRRLSFAAKERLQEQGETIVIESLRIDTANYSVTVDGRPVKLTPIEFGILKLLASHPGRVFSSEDIFEKIWKEKYMESSNSVTVHMSRLRDKLEKEMDGEKLIQTVWGVGYKIELA